MVEHGIGEVARRSGLAVSAVRYYERLGLVPRARRQGGKRRYGDEALAHLALIQVGKDVGFSLAEIATLVDGMARGDRSPAKLQSLARAKLPEVEDTLRRVRLMQRFLRAAASCRCPSIEVCLAAAAKLTEPRRRARAADPRALGAAGSKARWRGASPAGVLRRAGT